MLHTLTIPYKNATTAPKKEGGAAAAAATAAADDDQLLLCVPCNLFTDCYRVTRQHCSLEATK
eukprot:7119-Heterococcus_DN1.PRE.1